jgi:hypothetical protein
MADATNKKKCVGTQSVTLKNNSVWLLQIPDAAMALVLKQLDPCSIASTAGTCSKLSRAVPQTISKATLRGSLLDKFKSFERWLERHNTSLSSLQSCSFASSSQEMCTPLGCLPCPQLRHLQVVNMSLQLDTGDGGIPGLLHVCTRLTALDVQDCVVLDTPAAFAAIAALPELQSLKVVKTVDAIGRFFQETQHPVQLTHLSLDFGGDEVSLDEAARLADLSALSNLANLELLGLPRHGVPGGVPAELIKLTSLHASYGHMDTAEQFQHLSKLTALQDLSLVSDPDYAIKTPLDSRGSVWHLSPVTADKPAACAQQPEVHHHTQSQLGWPDSAAEAGAGWLQSGAASP